MYRCMVVRYGYIIKRKTGAYYRLFVTRPITAASKWTMPSKMKSVPRCVMPHHNLKSRSVQQVFLSVAMPPSTVATTNATRKRKSNGAASVSADEDHNAITSGSQQTTSPPLTSSKRSRRVPAAVAAANAPDAVNAAPQQPSSADSWVMSFVKVGETWTKMNHLTLGSW